MEGKWRGARRRSGTLPRPPWARFGDGQSGFVVLLAQTVLGRLVVRLTNQERVFVWPPVPKEISCVTAILTTKTTSM